MKMLVEKYEADLPNYTKNIEIEIDMDYFRINIFKYLFI